MNTLENSCFQFQENDEASQECIRIMNERYNSNFIGKTNYFFWIANNTPDVFYKMVGGYNLIPATDYLALLTGKQLTEREKPCANCKETIAECACMRNICVKCNKPVGNITFSHCDKCFDILHSEPTQESVKDGSLGIEFTEQAQSAFDHYQYPSLINTLDTSAAFWIGWRQAEIFFSTQQTAHLQQQLKEAKELLEKTTSFCEDENMYPTVYHSINQFLTRNK